VSYANSGPPHVKNVSFPKDRQKEMDMLQFTILYKMKIYNGIAFESDIFKSLMVGYRDIGHTIGGQ